MKKIILVIGNSIDVKDSIATSLTNKIKIKFPTLSFIHWDPTEELPQGINKKIILIDAVIGITKVQTFNSLDTFLVSPRVTVHDFDLPVSLKLLQKIGKITSITIIGIPYGNEKKEYIEQLSTILQSI